MLYQGKEIEILLKKSVFGKQIAFKYTFRNIPLRVNCGHFFSYYTRKGIIIIFETIYTLMGII